MRLHKITKQEHLQKKQKEYIDKQQKKSIERQKTVVSKQYKPIKQQTTKERNIKKNLSDLKREIELEAIQNGTYYCQGCGCSYPGLDKSHILSIGQYKHMELVKENIQLLCRKDHMIWESGDIEQMINLNCFESNLAFIKIWDLDAYQRLLTKKEEYENNYFKK